MEIVFWLQGEEVYRVELPDNTERATFEFVESSVYGDTMIPLPVVSEIVVRGSVEGRGNGCLEGGATKEG